METLMNKYQATKLSQKRKEIIVDIAGYLFIILFMYTAASKILSIGKFSSTLSKSPLIGDYHLFVAWAVPIAEILISILLIFPAVRKWGLYASFLLMLAFTTYLIYMVLAKTELPCNCGGVISSMTWQQHIWFNLSFVSIAAYGLLLNRKL